MGMMKPVAIIAVFILCLLVLAEDKDYISLNVTEMDIRDVFRAVATSCGKNIIIEKSVNGKVTISLTDVYFETAIKLIAATNGYDVIRVDNVYMVGSSKVLNSDLQIRVYKTQFADPEKLSDTISKTTNKTALSIENSVIISGEGESSSESSK